MDLSWYRQSKVKRWCKVTRIWIKVGRWRWWCKVRSQRWDSNNDAEGAWTTVDAKSDDATMTIALDQSKVTAGPMMQASSIPTYKVMLIIEVSPTSQSPKRMDQSPMVHILVTMMQNTSIPMIAPHLPRCRPTKVRWRRCKVMQQWAKVPMVQSPLTIMRNSIRRCFCDDAVSCNNELNFGSIIRWCCSNNTQVTNVLEDDVPKSDDPVAYSGADDPRFQANRSTNSSKIRSLQYKQSIQAEEILRSDWFSTLHADQQGTDI